MALTKGQFLLYETAAKMQAALIKNDKRIELTTGERYLSAAVNSGGLLLASGNYANPISGSLEKVIPHTTSGTFTVGGAINQIRDSGAFTMPLGSGFDVDTILVAELPKTFTANTPTLTRSGTDLFRDDSGTDTSITWAGAARITLTWNGTEWSL
jgi:hypothetical protein